MEVKKGSAVENINFIRELALKMNGLPEEKHSAVYHLYEQAFTQKIKELNIDEMIDCYAETETINKGISAVAFDIIKTKIDALDEEDLNLLENFISTKENGLEEFEINPWVKIDLKIREEITRGNGLVSAERKFELAEKYDEIYRKKRLNNNIHMACLKIREYCKSLKDAQERKQKKSPYEM